MKIKNIRIWGGLGNQLFQYVFWKISRKKKFKSEVSYNISCNLVNKVKFASSYSFAYSPRPGTPASVKKDLIDEKVKKKVKLFTKNSC